MTRAGGCGCGAVRYTLTGPIRDVVVCHCDACGEAAGGPRVLGQEGGARRAQVRRQPRQQRAHLRLALGREGEAALQPLRRVGHHVAREDVAGVLQVGGEGHQRRDPALVSAKSEKRRESSSSVATAGN